MKMIACDHCGKRFSRVDSMQRHMRKYCEKSFPRHLRESRSDIKQVQPTRRKNIDVTCADIIIAVTNLLHQQRQEWKRDLKNFKMHTEMYSKRSYDNND
jgi:hypothetical protein